MDHRRTLGKSEEDNRFFYKRCPSSICDVSDGPLVKDDHFTEDPRLINWKKWLADRQKHYQRYKAASGRHQIDLVMNASEKFRPLVEMKNLMDYATIPVPAVPDKYRGNPGFWATPEYLSNRGNPCLPNIGPVLTKKQLNLPPELARVNLPTLIAKEKDLIPPCDEGPLWKRNEYLSKRKRELAETISLLEPKNHDASELIIEGHKCTNDAKYVPRIPVISITDYDAEQEANGCADRSSESVVILKIQDLEIVRDEELLKRATTKKDVPETLTRDLSFQIASGDRTKRTLRLENKGNVTISYHWREETFQSPAMPLIRTFRSFHFDKNTRLILPGQITELTIWFVTRNSNIASESWRIVTEPTLHPAPIVIRFWGCSTARQDSKDDLDDQSIDEYLDRRVRDSAIREILDDIVNDVRPRELPLPPYETLFVEAEIFKAKNPVYVYHAKEVNELRRIYESVTTLDSPDWSLSLLDLRDVLLRMKEPEARHEMLLRFSELCRECLKPNLVAAIGNTKFATVYNIMCSFANRFEVESEFLKDHFFPKENLSTGSPSAEDAAGSVSASRASLHSLSTVTPRRKRSRKKGQTSRQQLDSIRKISSARDVPMRRDSTLVSKRDIALYREVLFIRIYGLLMDTIGRACAAIDSLNNLNEYDK